MKIPKEIAEKIVKRGHCWLWTGHINNAGYGRYNGGRNYPSGYVHRIMFYLTYGYLPVYPNVVGHTCDVRNCINPSHLVEQTQSENVKQYTDKITSCPHGHPYDENNTYIRNNGSRKCKECHRLREEKRRNKSWD